MSDRLTRVNELLRREISEVLFRVMNEADADLSAVTVTHVITSSNLRHARVMVSIRGGDDVRDRMMNLIRHHRTEIQSRISQDIILKYTPRLSFELDDSLAQGHRILDLLSKIEVPDSPEDGAATDRAAPAPDQP